MKQAVLLSGGMDSVALTYWRRPEYAVTIDYGQRAAAGEVRAAQAVCKVLNVEHHVLRTDLGTLGAGDMVGKPPSPLSTIPEWWPFRNQMLITLGAMKAVALGADVLLIGCVRSDQSHADGRKDFVAACSSLLQMQEGGLTVDAPAVSLTAEELIRESQIPKEVLAWAHSCHVSDLACGSCRGCQKHYETYACLDDAY